MEYLADTVAVVRFLADTGKIGRKARKIFEETEKGQRTGIDKLQKSTNNT